MRSRRRRGNALALRSSALAATLALAPFAARAQETREYDLPQLESDVQKAVEEAVEAERPTPSLGELIRLRFNASNRFVGVADFGRFRAVSNQPEARVSVSAPVSRNAGIRLMGTGRILHYDFGDGDADLGIGNRSDGPFDDLYSGALRLQGVWFLDEDWTLFSDQERWSLLGEVFGRASWEKGGDLTESLRAGASLALGYRWKGLELGAGLSVRGRIGDGGGIAVRPVAELDWRIGRRWNVSTQGLGLQVERRFGERFTVFTRARWEGDSYRLADRPSINDPTLRIRQLPVGVGMWWNFGRHLRVTTTAGVVSIHQLEVEDERGRRIDRDTAEPSPYVLVRFDLRS